MKNYLLVNQRNEYFTGKIRTKNKKAFPDTSTDVIKAKFYMHRKIAEKAVKRVYIKTGMLFDIEEPEIKLITS
ncbi:hypothetical protein [Vallitalea guaymasensis]|uniref:hypothetical protein n=1 Tax=Vallitalea guaymasensis TaxID=1185412 RepID=UPI000DE281D5|nr:hypothetical protein [Vallitalea guaymasensis]